MNKLRSQGTAIFMALLIVAIVTSITVFIMRSQQIDIHRTEMMLTSDQAYLYTQGVIGWAKGAIQVNVQQRTPTHAAPSWPLILPPTAIANGEGTIAGSLQDAEGLINLNNFAATLPTTNSTNNPLPGNDTATVLLKLLTILHMPVSQAQGQQLIQAITAWVSNPAKPGATYTDSYDAQYRQAIPPYQSPHAFMVSASELRMVSGITPQLYNALLPYITALPDQTSLNHQHAPLPIQQALGQQSSQGSQPTQSTNHYFLLRTDVYLRDQHLIVYTLLQTLGGSKPGQPPLITTLWQSFGTV